MSSARLGRTVVHVPFEKEIAPEEFCWKRSWLVFIRLALGAERLVGQTPQVSCAAPHRTGHELGHEMKHPA